MIIERTCALTKINLSSSCWQTWAHKTLVVHFLITDFLICKNFSNVSETGKKLPCKKRFAHFFWSPRNSIKNIRQGGFVDFIEQKICRLWKIILFALKEQHIRMCMNSLLGQFSDRFYDWRNLMPSSPIYFPFNLFFKKRSR